MELIEVEESLARVQIFESLGRSSLRTLARLCEPRSYEAGELILEEEQPGAGMVMLTHGRVEIFKRQSDGERMVLAIVRKGDFLGEMALIDERPRSASAQALEPTEALLLSRENFLTLVRRSPTIAWALVPHLATRMRILQNRLVEAEGRLAESEKPPTTPEGFRESEETIYAISDYPPPPAVRLLRLQYATFMAGVVGLERSIEIPRLFLESFAAETRLRQDLEATSVVRQLPTGAATALRKSLAEGAKIPRRMVGSFLAHLG